MMHALVLQLVVALTSVCTVAHGFDNYGLPVPVFSMNITQDEDVGVEKRVFRRLASKGEDPGMAPLFEGLGTHYSFIWVGTPAQRVSVIMDTGSHHTAFPCTGCKCGKHMDPHFDPKKSSTNTIKSCGNEGKKCYFKQSYTEGSSWSAYKVRDKVWVGGPGEPDIEKAHTKAIDFDFGCQESETGLFRTQKVDGIMGLSAAPDTLPFQLHAAGITRTKMFALCFRTGGGVVTLGGVDTRLHAQGGADSAVSAGANRTSQPGLHFAQMTKAKGWYTVKMLDVLMRSPGSAGSIAQSEAKSIGGDASKYNTGKGTIVDSGTTDTYLPSALRSQFQALFRAVTGREYGNKQAHYTKEQFDRLPIIVFRLAGSTQGTTVDLEVYPSSYMEFHKDGGGSAGGAGRYTPRVYLTEGSGAVLGANSINEHNVIFDPDNLRVGFARSSCRYDKKHSRHDFATSTNAVSSAPKQDNSQPPKPPSPSNPKEKKEPQTSGKAKSGSSSSEKKNPEETKKKANVMKPPAKSFPTPVTEANKPSPAATKPTGALSPTRTPLSPAQLSAMDAVVAASARSFVASRHAACKPVLSIPCDARCDHSSFSEPVDGASSVSTIDYMHVDSRGEVSALTASVVKGQQYWKVPVCDDVAATRRTSLRGLKDGDGFDADFTAQAATLSASARTVREECAVTCTGRESGAGQVVRLNTALPVESAASPCDAVSHTRKQLQIDMSRTTDAPGSRENVLLLTKAGTQTAQCYVVEGAAAVHAGAGAAARHELGANTQCHTVAVLETACKPYMANCTSTVRSVNGARANFDAVSVDADDVVFTVHMRLKGLAGAPLSDFQEGDLVSAFASILKVPVARLSVAAASSVPSSFSFGLGSLSSVTNLQVFVRLNVASAGGDLPLGSDAGPPGFALPDEAVDLIALVSGSRMGSSSVRAHSVHRQIARDQLQAYLQAIVLQPEFPLLLASAVAEADPTLSIPSGATANDDTVKRPAWLVSSAVRMVGVGFLSGKIDSSTVSPAEKAHRDALNAAVCAGIDRAWTGYLSLPTDMFIGSTAFFSGPQGAWTLNAVMSLVLFAVLLTAGCFLRRRYILNRERASRDTGKPYAAEDADQPSAAQAGQGGSGAPHRAAHAPSHKDRRRKVLQKFSVKK